MENLGSTPDTVFQELRDSYGIGPSEEVDTLKIAHTYDPKKDLHVFGNPAPDGVYEIRLDFPEFTSLCPKTGQPDFATVSINYSPDELCVEMKSLKLYLQSFRNEGHFYEEITNMVHKDLLKVLDPLVLQTVFSFNARGGMPVDVAIEYTRPSEEDKPDGQE